VTGYLGATILHLFIKEGKYRIRATLRDNSIEKLEQMRVNMKVDKSVWDKIEFVKLDLMDTKSINLAVEGASYVVHSASPVCVEEPADP